MGTLSEERPPVDLGLCLGRRQRAHHTARPFARGGSLAQGPKGLGNLGIVSPEHGHLL